MSGADLPVNPLNRLLEIEVAAGLVFQDGRLLITQRRPEAHLGGLWEFPGGKRHAGESYEDCLARELEEELGIRVLVGECLERITHAYPDKRVHLEFFVCQLLSGQARPIACAALAWITPQDLARYAFPAADARLLARLRHSRNLWK